MSRKAAKPLQEIISSRNLQTELEDNNVRQERDAHNLRRAVATTQPIIRLMIFLQCS